MPEGPRKYDVFISYRREGGADFARTVRAELKRNNIGAFLDIVDLGSYLFDENLKVQIEKANNFIVIISEDAFSQRGVETDWFLKEIEHAIKTKRNIIPVVLEGATLPKPEDLPPELADLARFNAIFYKHVYHDDRMTKLIEYLMLGSLPVSKNKNVFPAIAISLALIVVLAIVLIPLIKNSIFVQEPPDTVPDPGPPGAIAAPVHINPNHPSVRLLNWPDDVDPCGFEIDSEGSIYIAGTFKGTGDFDQVQDLAQYESDDEITKSFLVKLDPETGYEWSKTWESDNDFRIQALGMDDAENLYVSGQVTGNTSFDPDVDPDLVPQDEHGYISEALWANFIIGLDHSASYNWSFTWPIRDGSDPQPNTQDICVDSEGNLLLSSNFQYNGGIEILNTDEFLTQPVRLVWGHPDHRDSANGITVDSDGNIIVVGDFEVEIDLDPGAGEQLRYSQGKRDAYILKLDPLGNFIWGFSWGQASAEYAYSVATDPSNNIYIVGAFEGTTNMAPGQVAYDTRNSINDSLDPFLIKIGAEGDYRWCRTWGSEEIEKAIDVIVDDGGNILVLGVLSGPTDLDPNDDPGVGFLEYTPTGEGDIYILFLDDKGLLR